MALTAGGAKAEGFMTAGLGAGSTAVGAEAECYMTASLKAVPAAGGPGAEGCMVADLGRLASKANEMAGGDVLASVERSEGAASPVEVKEEGEADDEEDIFHWTRAEVECAVAAKGRKGPGAEVTELVQMT